VTDVTKMDPRVKALWVDALFGGQYQQGEGCLMTSDEAGKKFCCLGVLCDLYIIEKNDPTIRWEKGCAFNSYDFVTSTLMEAHLLPAEVQVWAGFKQPYGTKVTVDGQYTSFAFHNDSAHDHDFGAEITPKTFQQIATAIKEQL
jgi:hypothetical protein